LTSALVGDEWSASRPSRFTSSTNWIGFYPAINVLLGHVGQILILENSQTMIQNKHKYAFGVINEEKITNFQSALQKNWEEVYNQENVNSKLNIFLHISLLNFENSFPLAYKKRDVTNK
jgi:hypothetical protein